MLNYNVLYVIECKRKINISMLHWKHKFICMLYIIAIPFVTLIEEFTPLLPIVRLGRMDNPKLMRT